MTEKNLLKQKIEYIREQCAEACIKASRCPDDVRIMAVTKYADNESVRQCLEAGITLIGENRVQQLTERCGMYDGFGVEKHIIGHLQTNKAKAAAMYADMVESVDSLHTAKALNEQCERLGKIMPVLLEVNIGKEESKSGIAPENLVELAIEAGKLSNIAVRGLMTVPPVGDEQQSRRYFEQMNALFIDIKEKKIDNIDMCVLSMGMSDDYLAAIAEGSTLVRLGRVLFSF